MCGVCVGVGVGVGGWADFEYYVHIFPRVSFMLHINNVVGLRS